MEWLAGRRAEEQVTFERRDHLLGVLFEEPECVGSIVVKKCHCGFPAVTRRWLRVDGYNFANSLRVWITAKPRARDTMEVKEGGAVNQSQNAFVEEK